MIGGRIVVGVNSRQLEPLADGDSRVAKVSSRDLGNVSAAGVDGASTAAVTIAVAHAVGVSVMATGGLAGLHRDDVVTFDDSAELTALARTPVLDVASGAASILDIGATLERLDTLGVVVVGFASHRFARCYLHDSGLSLDWSVTSTNQACEAYLRHRELSSSSSAWPVTWRWESSLARDRAPSPSSVTRSPTSSLISGLLHPLKRYARVDSRGS